MTGQEERDHRAEAWAKWEAMDAESQARFRRVVEWDYDRQAAQQRHPAGKQSGRHAGKMADQAAWQARRDALPFAPNDRVNHSRKYGLLIAACVAALILFVLTGVHL